MKVENILWDVQDNSKRNMKKFKKQSEANAALCSFFANRNAHASLEYEEDKELYTILSKLTFATIVKQEANDPFLVAKIPGFIEETVLEVFTIKALAKEAQKKYKGSKIVYLTYKNLNDLYSLFKLDGVLVHTRKTQSVKIRKTVLYSVNMIGRVVDVLRQPERLRPRFVNQEVTLKRLLELQKVTVQNSDHKPKVGECVCNLVFAVPICKGEIIGDRITSGNVLGSRDNSIFVITNEKDLNVYKKEMSEYQAKKGDPVTVAYLNINDLMSIMEYFGVDFAQLYVLSYRFENEIIKLSKDFVRDLISRYFYSNYAPNSKLYTMPKTESFKVFTKKIKKVYKKEKEIKQVSLVGVKETFYSGSEKNFNAIIVDTTPDKFLEILPMLKGILSITNTEPYKVVLKDSDFAKTLLSTRTDIETIFVR